MTDDFTDGGTDRMSGPATDAGDSQAWVGDGPTGAQNATTIDDAAFIEDAFDAMAEVDAIGADDLRAEWGSAAPQHLAFAHKAMEEFADPNLIAALEESGLGDHPAIIRVAAAIGRRLGDISDAAGRSRTARRGTSTAGAEKIQDEIDGLVAEHWGKPSYTSRKVQRRLQALYARLPGTDEPIVDGSNRVF